MVAIHIDEFEWDCDNEDHLWEKNITVAEANEVLSEERYRNYAPRHRDGILVYGSTATGRYLIIALQVLGQKYFRPATGCDMHTTEQRLYSRKI